jgi:hypothetical protein
MEDIYLDEKINTDKIAHYLGQIFSGLTVFHYDFEDDPPVDLDSTNPNHIFFNSRYNVDKIELRFTISIYRTPDKDCAERQIYIGKIFSDINKVRVLVPFTNPNEPDNPYYNLIFENGRTFLASDYDTNFADGTTGLVKRIKEYLLITPKFDEKAHRIFD